MDRLRTALLCCAALACAPAAPVSDAPGSQDAAAPTPSEARERPPTPWCERAECFRERAEAAEAAGIVDLAAVHRAQAYELEPTAEQLEAWLDALVRSGQLRRLDELLADLREAGIEPEIVEAYAGKARAGADGPLVDPGPMPEALRAALIAEAADGDEADPVAHYAELEDPSPRALARHADLLEASGELVEARRLRAAARVAIAERGGRLGLTPVRRWRTTGVAWAGDQLVLVRDWAALDRFGESATTELQRWSLAADGELEKLRSLYLDRDLGRVEPTADGQHLRYSGRRGLGILELATGRERVHYGLDEGYELRVATTSADHEHALVAVAEYGRPKAQVELRELGGDQELIASYELEGTTPTITRVYKKGQGTRHDNILNDTPTWPVALALSEDLRWVAVAGSDSKIRLYDRKRDKERLLAYTWTYEERRHQGANADRNHALDLRFSPDGASLWAVYNRGDVIRWRTRDGKIGERLRGTCPKQVAKRFVNRYSDPEGPQRDASEAEREQCGRAQAARFSPGLDRVVVSAGLGGSTRVRELPSGDTLADFVDPELPGDLLAVSADGRVALADLYGRPALWSEAEGLRTPLGKGYLNTGPIAPDLSADGRILRFNLWHRWAVWDLVEGRELTPELGEDERIDSMTEDGARFVVTSREGTQVRDREGERLYTPAANDRGLRIIGRFLLVHRADGSKRLVDLEAKDDGGVELEGAGERWGRHLRISADGSRLVSFGDGRLRVFATDTGALVHDAELDLADATLAPDGSWLAWIVQDRRDDKPLTLAHVRALSGPPHPRSAELEGWASQIVAAPNGAELLVVTEGGLARWWPGRDAFEPVEGLPYIGADRIHYTPDGRLLVFAGYEKVQVRKNEAAMPLLATLYTQLDGGWMVTTPEGAVDGSPSAPDYTLTVAEGPEDRLVHTGALAWDRLAVDQLWAQILLGRSVAPATAPPISELSARTGSRTGPG